MHKKLAQYNLKQFCEQNNSFVDDRWVVLFKAERVRDNDTGILNYTREEHRKNDEKAKRVRIRILVILLPNPNSNGEP
jgi:hypothetical protein